MAGFRDIHQLTGATLSSPAVVPPGGAFKGLLHISGVWITGFIAGEVVEPQPPGLSDGPGGSGKRYRRQYSTDAIDLETWRKQGKRLEARVETLQKKIQVRREQIDYAPSFARVKELKEEIAALYRTLLALLGELDMLKKLHDEHEALEMYMAYRAYRTLH